MIWNKEAGAEVFQLQFPSTWNELNQAQLLYIARRWEHWRQLSQQKESLLAEQAALVLELSNVSPRSEKKRLCNALSFIDIESGDDIINVCGFVFESVRLTKNILPKVRVGLFTYYYGPEDLLKDLTVEEFSFAFALYQAYMRAPGEDLLVLLMAMLYRPANPHYRKDGEPRVEFNNRQTAPYEKRIAKLPAEYKQATLLFFQGCLESLSRRYPKVFMAAGENDKANAGTFMDTVIAMSGAEFGPFESTKKTNLYVLLTSLQKRIADAEQREREMKRKP